MVPATDGTLFIWPFQMPNVPHLPAGFITLPWRVQDEANEVHCRRKQHSGQSIIDWPLLLVSRSHLEREAGLPQQNDNI